jgi:hypothetical protein
MIRSFGSRRCERPSFHSTIDECRFDVRFSMLPKGRTCGSVDIREAEQRLCAGSNHGRRLWRLECHDDVDRVDAAHLPCAARDALFQEAGFRFNFGKPTGAAPTFPVAVATTPPPPQAAGPSPTPGRCRRWQSSSPAQRSGSRRVRREAAAQSAPDSSEKDDEPSRCAGLGNQVLHARRRGSPHHRSVGLEPGEKRDDLVELCEDQSRQPAECNRNAKAPTLLANDCVAARIAPNTAAAARLANDQTAMRVFNSSARRLRLRYSVTTSRP